MGESKGGFIAALATAIFFWLINPGQGQESFFRGKTIRVIVGLAPGGGFDTYSRVNARHMGKHIAGTPAMVLDNLPAAASLLAANHV